MAKRNFWAIVLSYVLGASLVRGSSTVKTYSQERCFTQLTSTKATGTVPTATLALTLPLKFTITTTSTPTSTITPSATTSTSVTTVFTTSVVTSTVDLTIPASAGFTPLASIASADGYSYGKRDAIRNLKNRGVNHHNPRAATKCTASLSGSKVVLTPTQYPKAVQCYELVEVVTLTIATKTASKTVTVTVATPVATSLSTTISTVISTSFAPAASPVYAICQPNNILTHIAGNSIYGVENVYQEGYYTDSAYDCCVACAQASVGCQGYAYFPGGSNICYLTFTPGGTCDGSAQDGIVVVKNADDGVLLTAGNGNCGQLSIQLDPATS